LASPARARCTRFDEVLLFDVVYKNPNSSLSTSLSAPSPYYLHTSAPFPFLAKCLVRLTSVSFLAVPAYYLPANQICIHSQSSSGTINCPPLFRSDSSDSSNRWIGRHCIARHIRLFETSRPITFKLSKSASPLLLWAGPIDPPHLHDFFTIALSIFDLYTSSWPVIRNVSLVIVRGRMPEFPVDRSSGVVLFELPRLLVMQAPV
jgi:hypothetical protein